MTETPATIDANHIAYLGNEVDRLGAEVVRLRAELAEEKREHLRTIDDALRVKEAWTAREQEIAAAASVPDTGQARETGADWAARPRRSSPEDALSVRERLGTTEPAKRGCQAQIAPSWANSWVTCGYAVRNGKCVKYGHEQPPDTSPRAGRG